jgi:hypothetical protein
MGVDLRYWELFRPIMLLLGWFEIDAPQINPGYGSGCGHVPYYRCFWVALRHCDS